VHRYGSDFDKLKIGVIPGHTISTGDKNKTSNSESNENSPDNEDTSNEDNSNENNEDTSNEDNSNENNSNENNGDTSNEDNSNKKATTPPLASSLSSTLAQLTTQKMTASSVTSFTSPDNVNQTLSRKRRDVSPKTKNVSVRTTYLPLFSKRRNASIEYYGNVSGCFYLLVFY